MIELSGKETGGSTQRITWLHWWSDRVLSFRITRPPDYHFSAGQYARLGLPTAQNAELVWRAYSLVSASSDSELEFLAVIVPGGAFSSALRQCKVGDALQLDAKVFGFMTPSRFADGRHLWMIATGTGLGPFISMLREAEIWQRFEQLTLVHGVRNRSEITYADELAELTHRPSSSDARARLRVLYAVTREAHQQTPAPSDGGELVFLDGRITTLLTSGALERAAGIPMEAADARVMLCGNPAMIEEMRALLHARTMRPCRRALPGQFLTENYW